MMIRSVFVSIVPVLILPFFAFAADLPATQTVFDAGSSTRGAVIIPGYVSVSFNDDFPEISARRARAVADAYRSIAGRVASMIGTPFPPSRPVLIDLVLSPMSVRVQGSGDDLVMKLYAADSRSIATFLPHELTHVFLEQWRLCNELHLCEVMSQAVEDRLSRFVFIPSDLAGFAVAHIAPGNRFNADLFNTHLSQWIVGKDLHEYQYPFDYFLGQAMIRRLGISGDDTLSPMTQRLFVAGQAPTPDAAARTLGFADMRDLSAMMIGSYARSMRSIQANPFLSERFMNEYRRESSWLASNALPPPLSVPPIGGVFDVNPGIPLDPLRFYPPEAATPPPLSIPTDPSLAVPNIAPPAASVPPSVTYPAMPVPSAPRSSRPARLPTRPLRSIPFVP